ncbi:MAG: glycosyltransferase [Litoreibacter sp.]|nr:glycosyltransferase [Litoreibacter sp.]
MNILFLTSTLPRYAGDQQAPFVLEQAAAWKRARPEDKLFILAPHDASAAREEELQSVEIKRYPYMIPARAQTLAYPAMLPNIRKRPLRALQLAPFLFAQYRAAKSLIRAQKIDLIYAHWVMPQGLVAHRLNRVLGVPYILQNHSSDLAVFEKLGRVGRAQAQSVLNGAQAFFCVNSAQREAALRLCPDIACHVLPMGVSLDLSQTEPVTKRESAKYVLGSVSRLSRKKGIDHLIAALELLASQGTMVTTGIAGGGEDEVALKGLPENAPITFPGFLSGEDKLQFFKDCFAMTFPSVSAAGDVEGLPVALLEALAAGKPVIASKDTNIELLEEWPQIAGDIEFIADPTDTNAFAAAIERLLALSQEAAHARSERLRKIVGRYHWDRLIHEYLERVGF